MACLSSMAGRLEWQGIEVAVDVDELARIFTGGGVPFSVAVPGVSLYAVLALFCQTCMANSLAIESTAEKPI